MGPVGGAVEAGISSAVVAAEGAATAVAATAAKTAEAGLAGAAQAGAAAAEGAVQTAGTAVTETAEGAISAATEAAPGVISAGIEGAAQEGLATGAQTTLEASGPDAALNQIAEVQIAEVPTDTDATPLVPAQEAVPTEQSAQISPAEQTATQPDSGISKEIRDDPNFKRILEEERTAARERGEGIDDANLSEKALARYNQDKDKQAEQSQLTPEQQKIQQLEDKIQVLTEQNEQLLEKINELGKFMQELGEWAKGHEQDPKKKESLIALLLKIAAIIVVGSVIEGGKTAASPLPSPGR